MEFDHIGVPTTETRDEEMYVEETMVWVTDPADHPDAIEYLRYEDDSPVSGPVREQQHVAFQVDDLESMIEDEEVLLGPFLATESLKVVFVLKHGVVFEYMEHREDGDWFEGGDE